MKPRVIAIGDIHGCSVALRGLLEAIRPGEEDRLIPLGDTIDRGPDSHGVIEILLDLGKRCQLAPLLGNHEEMMLAALVEGAPPESWLQVGGMATLDSYGFCGDFEVIPATHLEFISSFVPFFESANHFCIHANYAADQSLGDQTARLSRWTSLDQQLPSAHQSGKVAIVGHTADHRGEILSLPHLKCLDTYCYGGGWLTAMELESGKIWQTNQQGQLRGR